MSQVLINQYLAELDRLKKVSGEAREGIVSEAFKDLLKGWGRQHDLTFVPQFKLDTLTKDKRYVDGALLHELRVPFGYWEAKDDKDDLDEEIAFKFKRGYPQDNIVFEDSREAVLVQNGKEVMRCGVTDVHALEKLLKLFFAFERPEIAGFRKAVAQFKTDLPAVLSALRGMIEREHGANPAFRRAAASFLEHAREAINPALGEADVREMLIQHILTEEIFSKVFDDSDYHRYNNVARELYRLEETFFKGGLKKSTLKALEPYYAAIRSAAARIASHHEKQTFLKVIYENFYKEYNRKAADRLGVVYTPNEIVRFMIEGADWLCEQHFGRNLIDKDVEILDPATGTGTFICELLEHFRGQPGKLERKYREELHANEVAILPYYVANLNIEATYAAITGQYEEFPNLVFVDTLDNVGHHTAAHGTTADLFGSFSEVNVARIKRQNSRRISVIIGNPPYNANQANENDNNKNREYPEIDRRIKHTYIAESTAQKTKLYDMYARFFRWASDRLDANGVLAFVTNRSFIDSRTFDGFRKTVAQEFAEIRIVDLGGDVRANPKLSGTRHNVFGIQTGVAISFFVKKAGAAGKKGARIFYARRPEMETAEEKLAWLGSTAASEAAVEEIRPDPSANWLDVSTSDFAELMPLLDKTAKARPDSGRDKVLFKMFSNGINTARDDWVTDFRADDLKRKVEYTLSHLAKARTATGTHIKWSRNLKAKHARGQAEPFDTGLLRRYGYRPFLPQFGYLSRLLIDELGQWQSMDAPGNRTINFPVAKSFFALASDLPTDFHFAGDTKVVSLYRLGPDGTRHDNITDWALKQFQQHYHPGRGRKPASITKEAIFHYVYAVLHDPVYREKYALNLKREFPRIPLYGSSLADFEAWAGWGEALMKLHIGYENVEPWKLVRADTPDTKARAAKQSPKCVLKSEPAAAPGKPGRIVIDSETVLAGVPAAAWSYRLGNRTAIDWVLDQHKEKKPKDPTVRERFDTYRFADHKERVIDLLARVVRVSVETVAVVEAMKGGPR
ncbi:MAG: N-6 DNA methylase [Rubrivivax sp.]|nr:N-6 DNA methylase [Rubrivivax sp.]